MAKSVFPILAVVSPYVFINFCNAWLLASTGAGSNDKAVFQVSVDIPVTLFKDVAISLIALLAVSKSPVVSTNDCTPCLQLENDSPSIFLDASYMSPKPFV